MADVLMLYNYFMVVRWQRERCFLLCLCTVNLLSASLLSLGNTQVNLVLLSLKRKFDFQRIYIGFNCFCEQRAIKFTNSK